MHRLVKLAIPVSLAAAVFAGLDGSYVVPLDHEAIRYATNPVDDPVARLRKRIDAGEIKLSFDSTYGYLPSVLRHLRVPVSSQMLVFSKTSFQAARIFPRSPRAIYFNDTVTVGWVRGGDVVEIAAQDPRQGVVFYTLDQERSSSPRLDRRDECLQCHWSGSTLGVPGLVVRSVYPERTGMPQFHAGSFVTDHRSPLKERWGGWFVTGTHGGQRHLGNVVVEDRDRPGKMDLEAGANVTSLENRFDTEAYLSPHSDIVALMVIEHQTRMTNLITRVGFETRMALHDNLALNRALKRPEAELSESTRNRIRNATSELVRYLLFTDEAPLEGRIKGASAFAEEFAALGPKDRGGRSLRELDLVTRLMRYRCSYMIYSEAFDALPAAALDRIYSDIWERLSASADGEAILDILRDTKPNLPTYFGTSR